MQDNDKVGVNKLTSTVLKSVDCLWEWRWALKTTCFIIFIDSILISFNRDGFLKMTLNPAELFEHGGVLTLVIVLCSLFFSIIFPTLFLFFQLFLSYVHPRRASDKNKEYQHGYVSSRELRDFAVINHNDFLLKICDEYDREHSKIKEERKEMANLLATLFVLCPINFFISSPLNLSIIVSLIDILGFWGIFLVPFSCLVSTLLLHSLWFVEWPDYGIKYPPLYKEKNKDNYIPTDRM